MDYALLVTNKGTYLLKGKISDSIYQKGDHETGSDCITIDGEEHIILGGTVIGSEPNILTDSNFRLYDPKPKLSVV